MTDPLRIDTDASTTALHTAYTYHCICTQLILATTTPLPELTTRQLDKSLVLPLPSPTQPSPAPHHATLQDTTSDLRPIILTLDDGFEKRYLHRCPRCDLVVGYQLDWAQYGNARSEQDGRRKDVVYLLPGGLLTTEEMEKVGKGFDLKGRIGLIVEGG